MGKKDYRVSVKVRNANLLRVFEESGYTCGSRLAALIGIKYSFLLAYTNMTRAPFNEKGDLRPCAEAICIFFHKLPEELWSVEQHYPLHANTAELDLSLAELAPFLPAPENPEALCMQKEQRALLQSMVEGSTSENYWGLPPLAAQILRLRYGFEGKAKTLDEISAMFGVSNVWISRVEHTGLRVLRKRLAKNKIAAELLLPTET